MTKNTLTASPTARSPRTRARMLTAVMVTAVTAVTAGSGVVATAAAAAPGRSTTVLATADRSPATGPVPGSAVMRDVARQVLGTGVPGYAARIDDGHRVTTTVAGTADTATGRPMTGSDQFEIGSNTKTFTSTLALQLVDRRQLELDAAVERYLPGVVPNGRNITVRMLLDHTSGLFSYTGDEGFLASRARDPQHVWTEREMLAAAFRNDPVFAPGKGFSYSNTNYTLVGMILEKLTGRSLPDLMRERIIGPLGLRHTYYADPRATNTGPGYAHGYAVSFAGAEPTYADTATWPIGGWGGAAGAIISTPADLSRFFSAVVTAKLFSRKQLAQMQTTVPLPAEYPIKGGYGLGLFRIDSPCGTVWGHGGDTDGHHSTAVVSADGRRTAISDSTAGPSDLTENPGLDRYIQVALAAQDVTVCRMLDRPVPASVLRALHGTTATPSAAR
jgi:D-alanyl-D-alanine carboxypeptidase